METYCGYAGAILEIDLTHQRVCRIPLPETYAMQLLSGKALAAQMMLDHTTGTETALSAENIMVFTASLLTGTTRRVLNGLMWDPFRRRMICLHFPIAAVLSVCV